MFAQKESACAFCVHLFQAFAMGAHLCQLGLVMLITHSPGNEQHLIAATILAAVALAWVAFYPCLPGAVDGVCPVPWIKAYRTGAAAAVLCTVGTTYLLQADILSSSEVPVVLAAGWAVCAFGAIAGVGWAKRSARIQAERRVQASDLATAVAAIEQVTGGALCVVGTEDDNIGSSSSSTGVALTNNQNSRSTWVSDRGRQMGAWSQKLRAAGSVADLATLLVTFEDQVDCVASY